jgi:Domain of unknown function (DUF4136)
MWKLATLLTAALLLGGCATVSTVDSDVSTYSQWPPGRAPGSYAFERLPSQEARPGEQQALEDAARPALEGAGFTAAADLASAEVRVQLAARLDTYAAGGYYADPFGGFGGTLGWGRPFGRRYGGASFGFGFRFPPPTVYERQVMLLLRDSATGRALFEARASTDGPAASQGTALPALFQAAMKDFPDGGVNPRRISVDLAAPPP